MKPTKKNKVSSYVVVKEKRRFLFLVSQMITSPLNIRNATSCSEGATSTQRTKKGLLRLLLSFILPHRPARRHVHTNHQHYTRYTMTAMTMQLPDTSLMFDRMSLSFLNIAANKKSHCQRFSADALHHPHRSFASGLLPSPPSFLSSE